MSYSIPFHLFFFVYFFFCLLSFSPKRWNVLAEVVWDSELGFSFSNAANHFIILALRTP